MAQDLSCSSCGQLMWRHKTSLPAGQAMCLPCRRQRRPAPAAHVPELRFCAICQEPFETKRATQKYCNAECRNQRRGFTSDKAATASERGYGAAHQQARREWKAIVDAQGGIDCCLCGEWVEASERWHLDHTPDRDGYRGVAHALCNVRDGASRGATKTNLQRSYTKECPTCRTAFTTAYPKQTYCSTPCRPKVQRRPKAPKQEHNCTDCGTRIARGKRCAPCAKVWQREQMRVYMRNRYRASVGIPIDAPLIKTGRPRAA